MPTLYNGNRVVDNDPAFDNSKLGSLVPGKVPYTKENTYSASNGDMQDYRDKTGSLTAMQQHVAFFDGDADGVIWPLDTFRGFYSLGFGFIISFLAIFIIHSGFSYPTSPYKGDRLTHWIPDPCFRIFVSNIHRCKHGSDTESFDRRGRFQQNKFKAILDDYSSAKEKDSLSFRDGMVMILERRNLMDFFGIFAFIFEWGSTYYMLWPEDGLMKKDEMIGVIDGSIFPLVAYRNKNRKSKKTQKN